MIKSKVLTTFLCTLTLLSTKVYAMDHKAEIPLSVVPASPMLQEPIVLGTDDHTLFLDIFVRIIDLSTPKTRVNWFATCTATHDMVLRRCYFVPKQGIKEEDYLILARPYGEKLISIGRLPSHNWSALMVQVSLICPRLRRLNLSYQKEMSATYLNQLANNLPEIRDLNLWGTEVVREDYDFDAHMRDEFYVQHLSLGQIVTQFPKLDRLVCTISSSTTQDVLELSQICGGLKSLTLQYGKFDKFPGIFLRLEELDLSHSENLTPDEIVGISQSHTGLTKLVLDRCVLLTPVALDAVLQNCVSLKELNVQNCDLITPEDITRIREERPSLRVDEPVNNMLLDW
ncbi:MAG: hypothetical protein K2Y18_03085 [Alphaproteobacteria bacterium]|jgi:hypothetical protein|nr:hypothetical protein [Alphaproteobacteria bacterium]